MTHSTRFFVFSSRLSITFCLLSILSPHALASSSMAADAAIKKFVNDYTVDVFDAVSSQINYEPYAGIQRGAEGTALSGSGNSIDQAMLLAAVLDGQIAQWRLANGRLSAASVSHLLSRSSPAYEDGISIDSDKHTLYDPVNDKKLRKLVRNHYWLEIKEEPDDPWVALDPSFPDARFGHSIAKAVSGKTAGSRPERKLKQFSCQHLKALFSGIGRIIGTEASEACRATHQATVSDVKITVPPADLHRFGNI